jgi:hypothetical protein
MIPDQLTEAILETFGPPCPHTKTQVTQLPMDTYSCTQVIRVYCHECEKDELLMIDHQKLRESLEFRPSILVDPFKDRFVK